MFLDSKSWPFFAIYPPDFDLISCFKGFQNWSFYIDPFIYWHHWAATSESPRTRRCCIPGACKFLAVKKEHIYANSWWTSPRQLEFGRFPTLNPTRAQINYTNIIKSTPGYIQSGVYILNRHKLYTQNMWRAQTRFSTSNKYTSGCAQVAHIISSAFFIKLLWKRLDHSKCEIFINFRGYTIYFGQYIILS